MTKAAEPGTTTHPAFKLMLAVNDQDPGAVKMLLDQAQSAEVAEHLRDAIGEGNGLREIAFHVAGLAVALWSAPCSHCSQPMSH